jgi:hypothetical protein
MDDFPESRKVGIVYIVAIVHPTLNASQCMIVHAAEECSLRNVGQGSAWFTPSDSTVVTVQRSRILFNSVPVHIFTDLSIYSASLPCHVVELHLSL